MRDCPQASSIDYSVVRLPTFSHATNLSHRCDHFQLVRTLLIRAMAHKLLYLAAAGLQLASAHMEMSYPIPFNSKLDSSYYNNIDYSMTNPLIPSGSNYPCKGYHTTGQDKVQATFAAGGAYTMSVMGTATHLGGSCQLSLSYDNGKTFRVIKSIIGNCPIAMKYDFVVPRDAPAAKDAIFAWTWFNYEGNREMYMNCARVAVTSLKKRSRVEVAARQIGNNGGALSQLPQNFICNLANGCSTIGGTNVEFPDPGPAVQRDQGAPNKVPGPGYVMSGNNVAPTGNTPSNTAPIARPTSVSATNNPPAVSSGTPNAGFQPRPVSSGGVFVTMPTGTNSPTVPSLSTSTRSQAQAPSTPSPIPHPLTPCGVLGAIICNTETTWSMCDYRGPVFMGSTAAGMKCVTGQMVPVSLQV